MDATFTAAVVFFCEATTQPPVTFESACECRDAHGKGRWTAKNDLSLAPADASLIQSVTPSDMFGWPGPHVYLNWQSERTGIENKWFAVRAALLL